MSEADQLGSNLDPEVSIQKAPRTVKVKAGDTPAVNTPKKGRVRIVLEENPSIPPTGQFMSVNGKPYILRPGVEVDVPAELLSALNDAVEDRPVVGSDARVIGYRKALRFPYRRVHSVE